MLRSKGGALPPLQDENGFPVHPDIQQRPDRLRIRDGDALAIVLRCRRGRRRGQLSIPDRRPGAFHIHELSVDPGDGRFPVEQRQIIYIYEIEYEYAALLSVLYRTVSPRMVSSRRKVSISAGSVIRASAS